MERRYRPSRNSPKRKAAMTGSTSEFNDKDFRRGEETPLESWKEIAAYLQRDVKTAHRWEKREGLPVHRHLHKSRASVYAYPRELDAWRTHREPVPDPRRPSWLRPVPALASTIALAVVVLMAGTGPPVGAVAQAADGIVTRQVWADAEGGWPSFAASPDGRYLSYADGESGDLAVRDLETETRRLLTNEGSWEQAQYLGTSRWSPDGEQIAYTWPSGTGYELRMVAVDNPEPRVIFRGQSDGAGVDLQDWSPDGQSILVRFITGPAVVRQLALIPVEGGDPRVVKEFESGSISPGGARFSPDGRYIVYHRTPGQVAALDLFVLDVSSGEETPLLQHPADDCVFGWSPDGKSVLFLSDRTGSLDFWTIGVADGKPQGDPVMVKPAVGRVWPLGFARDGTFYYAALKVARDVYAARVDFEEGTVLTPARKAIKRYEGSNMNPSYSPDGRSLAYVSRRGSMVVPTARGNALCVRSLDTGAERVFMDEFAKLGVRFVMGPRWSPDSNSIVVAGVNVAATRFGNYAVRLDTGDVTPAVELPESVSLMAHDSSAEDWYLFYLGYDRNQGLSHVVELNLETGQERELYQFAATDDVSGIAASPNGKWLAARGQDGLLIMPREEGTAADMRHIDLSGLDPQIRTMPVWTPDGDYLLVSGNTPTTDPNSEGQGVLYRVPFEGGQPQRITLQRRFWPGETLTVHPDGRQIAFTSVTNRDSDADVWAIESFLPEQEDGP